MNAVAALSTLAMMLMVANAQAEDSAPAMTLVPNGSQASILGSPWDFTSIARWITARPNLRPRKCSPNWRSMPDGRTCFQRSRC